MTIATLTLSDAEHVSVCCSATTTRRPKQITVRAPRARAAAASYGVGKKIYNEAEQRRGERLLACCCVPDPRALFRHDRDGARRREGHGTRDTPPFFCSAQLANVSLPAPAAPTGTAGRSAGVALVRPPFPRRLSLSVWRTVCTLYVGWVIGLVRCSRWTPMPTPQVPPKAETRRAYLVHRSYDRRE